MSLEQGRVNEALAMRSDATIRLIRAILARELTDGELLDAHGMAQRFDINVAEVQPAIVELAAIGLVDLPKDAPPAVRPFGAQELFEMYHLRGVLEIEAVRLACDRIPLAKLLGLKLEAVELSRAPDTDAEQWVQRVIAHDRNLHELILDHCDNRRLAHEIGRYMKFVRAVAEITTTRHKGILDVLHQHLQIIDALLIADRARAVAAMAEHLRQAVLIDVDNVFGASQRDLIVEPSLMFSSGKRFLWPDEHDGVPRP